MQKRPVILRSLLIVATPCCECMRMYVCMHHSNHIILTSAEYRHFYRALLQKRPRILRNLLIEASPYQMYHSHHIIHNMGWLRLVGSLKLQVSFAKEPYKRDHILQKRPIICMCVCECITHTTSCSLLQNIVTFIGLFCKRDLEF